MPPSDRSIIRANKDLNLGSMMSESSDERPRLQAAHPSYRKQSNARDARGKKGAKPTN